MQRNRKSIAPLAVAGSAVAPLLAVAVAFAPTAAANSNEIRCLDSGTAKVCGKQGHASLHAKPTPRSPQGGLFSSPWLPGYGKGHLPPLLALD
ncbi:MAG TPA: hypothetical protein PKK01_17350 [Mycobacterium sp.]|nr:MAG: hypothetical protein E6Q56_09995 [Mycobacterium sp.]HOB51055.1 hypothetical protein [Mycobacterium sp.]HPZ95095.1 hypothetical protein [Mycobacterium sp.]HQE15283.1 hypothetical protein [Mycobacterium sp.]